MILAYLEISTLQAKLICKTLKKFKTRRNPKNLSEFWLFKKDNVRHCSKFQLIKVNRRELSNFK